MSAIFPMETPSIMNYKSKSNKYESIGASWGDTSTAVEQAFVPPTRSVRRVMAQRLEEQERVNQLNELVEQLKEQTMATQRRIVQVFIADPDEKVPLEEMVLYKGEQKATDLTDQELFFEVPINDLLKAHNEKRVKTVDKEATKATGKETFLEPIRIRNLKMVVVDIATF